MFKRIFDLVSVLIGVGLFVLITMTPDTGFAIRFGIGFAIGTSFIRMALSDEPKITVVRIGKDEINDRG